MDFLIAWEDYVCNTPQTISGRSLEIADANTKEDAFERLIVCNNDIIHNT